MIATMRFIVWGVLTIGTLIGGALGQKVGLRPGGYSRIMPTVSANGIDLCYETIGSGDPLLLVHGLGAQLIDWHDDLYRKLGDRGFSVTRYDNRDIGLSTKIEDKPAADLGAILGGDTSTAPYRVADMAADAAGLIEGLGLARAHVVGVSMGGMIVQQLAIDRPDLVRSLCSIMSTTGDPSVGRPSDAALRVLLAPPPTERDAFCDREVETWKVIGSPGFAFDEAEIRRRAAASFDRSFYPEGVGRQLAAIVASPDRTEALGSVGVPALVVHGEDDALIDVSGGRATAAAIPGAELLVIPGMGHNLPPEVWGRVVDAIAANTARATTAA
jgi:pimeloyl-ACP methyl ester carboxylesterase